MIFIFDDLFVNVMIVRSGLVDWMGIAHEVIKKGNGHV